MLPGRNIRAYIARIKNASLPEIVYRIRQTVTIWRVCRTINRGRRVYTTPLKEEVMPFHLEMPSFVMKADESVIEGIICGRVFTLGGSCDELDRFVKTWRNTYFTKIQLIPDSPDIRMVWEPARLQHLTILIIFAHYNPGDPGIEAVKSFIHDTILKWIRRNQFFIGPHYISPMECGLRTQVLIYALLSLDNLISNESHEILESLHLHAWWVSRNISLYSSIGNHTVCECIGLIFSGAIFKKTKEGQKWLEKGCALLEQELFHQVLADGGPVEQSFGYHKFVLDLYWLAVGFLEKNHLYDCSSWKNRLMAGDMFLTSMCYDNELYPSIGDCDDGYAVAPGITPARDKDYDVRGNLSSQVCKTFDSSGYSVVRQQDGLFLTFDHGPLGMAPLYNHGHADALSITLYKNKKPFLIDPGTYRYNGAPEQRKYFKGTRAHNTVCIDGKDQAEQVTGFIWDKAYESRLISKEIIEGRLKASHNGYRRLRNPVEHQRELIIEREICVLLIDTFKGKEVHTFELNFHLDPNVHIEKSNNWIVLNNSGESISIYNPDGMFTIIYGQNEPLLGWYSPFYGVIEKTHTLQATAEGDVDMVYFKTLICLSAGKEKESLQFYNQSQVRL